MKIAIILVICFPLSFFGQNSSFWISFTDKNNSLYSVTQPSDFLSQKSIERRTNAGISILTNDLPVNDNYIDSILVSGNFELLQASKWFNAIVISTDDTTSLNTVLNYSFVSDVLKVKSLSQEKVIDKFEDFGVTKNGKVFKLEAGDSIDIPVGVKHRIENANEETLIFIEVQTGLYFGEDDIVRLNDDYKRD